MSAQDYFADSDHEFINQQIVLLYQNKFGVIHVGSLSLKVIGLE